MPQFVVKMEGRKEMSFLLDEDDIFIGRVPAINDICIGDPSVSRQHAHVKRREEGFTIYDLKSLNGVFLNGEKVSRAVLKDGDLLRLGDVEVQVRFRGASEEEMIATIQRTEITAGEALAEVKEEEVTRATRRRPPGSSDSKKKGGKPRT
ncbi:MAG: FHA domain-containing protein [Pseudomonadota bacterium]